MQQITPIPEPHGSPPDVRIQVGTPPIATETSNVKVLLKGLRVKGSHVYSEVKLFARTGFVPNIELTLAHEILDGIQIGDTISKFTTHRTFLVSSS